ncbi:polymorphic toxin type 50 domain-containing protein [[Collinsella] massiliensis]|uniref:polymorphic toxin type 50 domain-containing protein n=1 Tax=[Collinsella] massiliensis TaxID=1232426 RepID=UPI001F134D1B|nr:polymorphic toxin type 50 domain-containing protein [[Collinsella] massiliensis]
MPERARRDNSWNGRDVRCANRTVGYIVNKDRSEALTRGFKIHYSKRETHIVPFEVYEEMEDA